jgi:hypothetical protein
VKSQTFNAQKNLQATVDMHRVLQSAYTFVRSVEVNKAVAVITLDGLLKDHIDALKQGSTRQIVDASGKTVGSRLSRWDQLDELATQFNSVISAIQKAGTDPAALNSLGVFETDQPTVSNSSASTTASGVTP